MYDTQLSPNFLTSSYLMNPTIDRLSQKSFFWYNKRTALRFLITYCFTIHILSSEGIESFNSSYSNILSLLPSFIVFFHIQLNWLLCPRVQSVGIDTHSHILDRDIPDANNTSLKSSQEIYHNKRGQKNLDISGLLCYSPPLFSNHLRQADRNYCYNFCWYCIYIPYWLSCKSSGKASTVMCSFNLHTETLRVYYLVYLQCPSPLRDSRKWHHQVGNKRMSVVYRIKGNFKKKSLLGHFTTHDYLLQFSP